MDKEEKKFFLTLAGVILSAFIFCGIMVYCFAPRIKEIKKEKAEIIKIYTHDGGFMGSDKVYTVFQFEDGQTKTVRGVRGKEGQFYNVERIYYE